MWRDFTDSFAEHLSGERAIRQASEQNRIERYFTFPNFERSADRCGEELSAAGLSEVEVEEFPADGKTSWSGWGAMKAWDVTSARLWMTEPHRALLADWEVKPHCLVMYSGPFEEEGELVEWEGETDVSLRGKIPFTRQRINDVFAQMQSLGVHGILSDFIGTLPGVRDRFDLPDDVRWENSAIRRGHGAHWGLMLSPRQGRRLRDLLRKGTVRVRAEIRSRNYVGKFKSATGVIPGAESEDEILFVTHLYEPGANDNASGVGLGLEIARALNGSIESGLLPRPRRAVRFLFNWEGYGLYAWMHRHQDRLKHLLGGINIDEIGIDQAKGRSVVHLFMPPAANNSCIGYLLRHLCGKILSPGVRWRSVADRAEIINDTITSDPNMDVVLPCLIQYPSRNYHSSADTLDTLSAEVMQRIGMVTGTHLWALANMEAGSASLLGRIVLNACREKLHDVELRLLDGTWPFAVEPTERWFAEQFGMAISSLSKFGLDEETSADLNREAEEMVGAWLQRRRHAFQKTPLRDVGTDEVESARVLIPSRRTLGTPKAWGSVALSPEEEREYRRILYENRLDLLFHRICYWADGRRSVLDIVERLEFEVDELLCDTGIARTSSGTLIAGGESPELDLGAVMYTVNLLIKGGYLAAESRS